EGDARAPAVVERLDGDRALRADRPVEAQEGSSAGRVVLGDLVGDPPAPSGNAARVDRTRPHPGRAVRLHLHALDLLLPLAVPAQVVEVREHLLRALRDL